MLMIKLVCLTAPRAGMGLPQSGALPSLAQELCRKEMIGIGGISNLRKE